MQLQAGVCSTPRLHRKAGLVSDQVNLLLGPQQDPPSPDQLWESRAGQGQSHKLRQELQGGQLRVTNYQLFPF